MRVESVNFSIIYDPTSLRSDKKSSSPHFEEPRRRVFTHPSGKGPSLYDARALVVVVKERGQIIDLYA